MMLEMFFQVFCLFQHIFSYVVQKHTLDEVGYWAVIWWQVVSGMFVSKIIKIW